MGIGTPAWRSELRIAAASPSSSSAGLSLLAAGSPGGLPLPRRRSSPPLSWSRGDDRGRAAREAEGGTSRQRPAGAPRPSIQVTRCKGWRRRSLDGVGRWPRRSDARVAPLLAGARARAPLLLTGAAAPL
jgi:hypothetical protein